MSENYHDINSQEAANSAQQFTIKSQNEQSDSLNVAVSYGLKDATDGRAQTIRLTVSERSEGDLYSHNGETLTKTIKNGIEAYLHQHGKEVNIETHADLNRITIDLGYFGEGTKNGAMHSSAESPSGCFDIVCNGMERMEKLGAEAFLQENAPSADWQALVGERNQLSHGQIGHIIREIASNAENPALRTLPAEARAELALKLHSMLTSKGIGY